MERVLGIGGIFFRARDTAGLSKWYAEHLGVTAPPSGEGESTWEQEAGPTVFAPFEESTGYFGRAEQKWMINFRVKDLDAMVRQLRGAGIDVKIDPEASPIGRFARLHDPEGNPIELWEPKG
jgi:glyoxylase I family protein